MGQEGARWHSVEQQTQYNENQDGDVWGEPSRCQNWHGGWTIGLGQKFSKALPGSTFWGMIFEFIWSQGKIGSFQGIVESLRLEKSSKIIQSNLNSPGLSCHPSTAPKKGPLSCSKSPIHPSLPFLVLPQLQLSLPLFPPLPLALIKNHVHPPLVPALTVCIFNFVFIKFSRLS